MKWCALKLICDANSIKIGSSFKYGVIFGASGAHSLFCALFINCFGEEGNFAKKREGSLFKGVSVF